MIYSQSKNDRPALAITLGDVAGIGPEILVRAWTQPGWREDCSPIVVGNPAILRREAKRRAPHLEVHEFPSLERRQVEPNVIACFNASDAGVESLMPGRPHAAAGQAAYDYLVAAIDAARDGAIDGIVTLPLHKEGLRAAGLPYPGHTEILGERLGVKHFGMMLYRRGLGVLHATLHVALRDVFASLTTDRVFETIRLLDAMMRRLQSHEPRLAVAALNPHASDGGLFGDEERRIIAPAVDRASEIGIQAVGPIPADAIFARASQGEFDGVAAMYHDQGHIALKLLGWREAVNITCGLPIVRVSVAHGTAYDIVGKDQADPASLREAVAVAARLCRSASAGS